MRACAGCMPGRLAHCSSSRQVHACMCGVPAWPPGVTYASQSQVPALRIGALPE